MKTAALAVSAAESPPTPLGRRAAAPELTIHGNSTSAVNASSDAEIGCVNTIGSP
jgi:hypothetical protein